jgi:subtilase family serine protease
MRLSSSTGRRIVAGLGAGATVLAVVSVAQPASAVSARRALSGSRPTWTGQAHDEGHTAKSTRIDFGVLLKMRNQSQAVSTLQAISTPGSPSYGKWLTNAQFTADYAPKASDVSAVRSWLRGQGFTVAKTLKSGMYVEVTGSTAQVEKTFGTSMHTYSYKKHTVLANTSTLSLPSNAPGAVADAVANVVGVDQGSGLKTPAYGWASSRARRTSVRRRRPTSPRPTASSSRTPRAGTTRCSCRPPTARPGS